MPYIVDNRRDLRDVPVRYAGTTANGPGDLNFILTTVVLGYLDWHNLSYQTLNDIVGALDNCKDEFRRRIQHKYEDEQIKANGDVYEN